MAALSSLYVLNRPGAPPLEQSPTPSSSSSSPLPSLTPLSSPPALLPSFQDFMKSLPPDQKQVEVKKESITTSQYLAAYETAHSWITNIKAHTKDFDGIEDTPVFVKAVITMKRYLLQYIHYHVQRMGPHTPEPVTNFKVITFDELLQYWIHCPMHHKQTDINLRYSLFELTWLMVIIGYTAIDMRRILSMRPDPTVEAFRRTTGRMRTEYSESTLKKQPLTYEQAMKRVDAIAGYTVFVISHGAALHLLNTKHSDPKAVDKQINERYPELAQEIIEEKTKSEEDERKMKKDLLGLDEFNDSERVIMDPVTKKIVNEAYVAERINTQVSASWSDWIPWMCMASMSYITTQYLMSKFHHTNKYILEDRNCFKAIKRNVTDFIAQSIKVESDGKLQLHLIGFTYESAQPFGAMEWYLRDRNLTQPNYEELLKAFHTVTSKQRIETRLNKSIEKCYEEESTSEIESVVVECIEWSLFRSRMFSINRMNIDHYFIHASNLLNRIPDLLERKADSTEQLRRPYILVLEGRFYIHWFPPFQPVRPHGELIDAGSLQNCIAIWIHMIYLIYNNSLESGLTLNDRWPMGLMKDVPVVLSS